MAMDTLLILLALAASLALVFSPLLRKRRIWFVGDVENELVVLTRRREEALRALKDIEEERLSGKLSEDDFAELRPEYLEQAMQITRDLDARRERAAAARKRIEEELAGKKA